MREKIFLVGARYSHHAAHSGYEAFGPYVASALPAPVQFRWIANPRWDLNRPLAMVARHPWYSPGALITETATFRDMLRYRGSHRLYHMLYGDSDLWWLGRAHRYTGNRLVASFHEPTAALQTMGAVERVSRRLDGVILVSEVQRPYFESFMDAARVHVVPHGVNTQFFTPPLQTPERPVCYTLGSHLRDFQVLGKAIELVWRDVPEMEFIAVGTRTDPKCYFHGPDDPRITYLDRVSDERLLAILQSARVGVFAFKDATANNAVMESMACGVPVVGTAIGGIGEYIRPDCGFLCPPHDPRALADAVLRLLGDTALRERMSKAARRTMEELDFRNVAEQMRDVYARVLNGG